MLEPTVDDDLPTAVIETPRLPRWAAIAGINAATDRGRSALAAGTGMVALAVVALVTLFVFRLQSLPITGEGSIGFFGASASAIVAAVVFVGGRCVVLPPKGTHPLVNILDVAALAIAHALIALVAWTLVGGVIESGFIDAVVFGLPSVFIAGTMAALTAYAVFMSAVRADASSIAVVLVVFLVSGAVASVLTASDPHWWKDDFSSLGKTGVASALTFNGTLIVGGVIVATLARYGTRGISTAHARGVALVRGCLISIGILLALVGVVPVDVAYGVHTAFACGLAVVFGVLVALVPRWIPELPRLFVLLGWLFLAVLAVHFVLFATGSYTLAAVELVAGVLVIGWIVLFIRNAAALPRRDEDE